MLLILSPQCCEHEHLSAHLSKARVHLVGKWVKGGAALFILPNVYVRSFHTQSRPNQLHGWIAISLIRAWDDASHLSLDIVNRNFSRMHVAVSSALFRVLSAPAG